MFKRVWHREPSMSDPDTVYVGVEDAALFRTTDGGKSWHELAGLRGHGTGPYWSPGAGGMCLHTILFDPLHQGGGVFRSDDAGDHWIEVNGNLPTDFGFPIDVHAHEAETMPNSNRSAKALGSEDGKPIDVTGKPVAESSAHVDNSH